jgi:hypothetical protein
LAVSAFFFFFLFSSLSFFPYLTPTDLVLHQACPHGSFPLPQDENDDNPVVPRESVESRAFIFYGPKPDDEEKKEVDDFPEEVGTLYGDRG